MTLVTFQELSKRTMNPDCQPEDDDYILGLIGESGEVTDLIKKHLWQGHKLDRNKLCAELGDVCFYLAAEATLHGITLGDDVVPIPHLGKPLGWLCRQLARDVVMYEMSRTDPENRYLTSVAIQKNALQGIFSTIATIGMTADIGYPEILQRNHEKLLARYPDGFSHHASQNRAA